MNKELACKECKCITIGRVCPNCKSTDLTKEWRDMIIVADPNTSGLAKMLKITTKGKYAIKVMWYESRLCDER